MTAECSRCGDCCEDIYLSATKTYLRQNLRAVDPEKDPEAWIRLGWSVGSALSSRANARFILQHWHSAGRRPDEGNRHRWSCDAFDPATRLCTAHDTRPPVCSGYPYYGAEPGGVDITRLPDRCSFREDWQTVTLMPTSTE